MKRKGFDLQARVAVTQLTQKKYSALQSAAPSLLEFGGAPTALLKGV